MNNHELRVGEENYIIDFNESFAAAVKHAERNYVECFYTAWVDAIKHAERNYVECPDKARELSIKYDMYWVKTERVKMMKRLKLTEGLTHRKFLGIFNRRKRVDSIGREYGWFMSVREIWSGGGIYLRRTHLLPANNFLNLYLHEWFASDDLNAPHNHPWNSLSVCLRGKLNEMQLHVSEKDGVEIRDTSMRRVKKWTLAFRKANFFHAIDLPEGQEKPPITLFATGPVICKDWIFWCLSTGKKIHNKKYTNRDGSACTL